MDCLVLFVGGPVGGVMTSPFFDLSYVCIFLLLFFFTFLLMGVLRVGGIPQVLSTISVHSFYYYTGTHCSP